MATHTLVEPIGNEAASLIGMVLRSAGISITEQFWVISAEPHQRLMVLISPQADTQGARNLYERIFAHLSKIDFAPQDFVRTSILVFGEHESANLLTRIRSGHTTSLRVGPYENAEVIPIPPASEIHKSGMIHFIPVGSPDSLSCRVVFGAFGNGGWMKPRDIHGEMELREFLETLAISTSEIERVTNELRVAQPSQTLLSNVPLDVLYRLGLI